MNKSKNYLKNKPLGSIVIYNENNKEDHKEHVINDLNDLENLKMKLCSDFILESVKI